MEAIIELFRLAKEGDKKAKESLHAHYDSLFRYYADKYAQKYKRLVEFDDLLQECHIGLIKATQNVDLDKVTSEKALTSYVYLFALGRLIEACRYNATDLAVTVADEEEYVSLIPDPYDLEEDILDLESNAEDLIIRKMYLNSLLEDYDPRDQAIIKLRLGVVNGFPRTLTEVASLLDMSVESIRQRERSILEYLVSHKADIRRV